MPFKNVPASTPGIDKILGLLPQLYPGMKLDRVGYNFDDSIYRCYVLSPERKRFHFDVEQDLFDDIRDDPHDNRNYTKHLESRLAAVVESAIPRNA